MSLYWNAALLIVAVALSACSQGPNGTAPPNVTRSPYDGGATMQQLQQLPEANAFYPDSEVLSPLGYQSVGGVLGGHNPSYAGFALGSPAGSQEDILGYYKEYLLARGWQFGGEGISSTSEEAAYNWSQGKLLYRLAIRKKQDPLAPPPSVTRKYATLYDIKVRNLTSDGR